MSSVVSDEDPAYHSYSRLFNQHQAINHSTGYSDGKGGGNNPAESFNWHMRRSAEGVYLSPPNKYPGGYVAENAWRGGTRDRLRQLLRTVMGVGGRRGGGLGRQGNQSHRRSAYAEQNCGTFRPRLSTTGRPALLNSKFELPE